MWSALASTHVLESQRKESDLTFQLLRDRLLKQLIKNKAIASKCTSDIASENGRPLTTLESNAVRYMAGFVAVRLLRRYRKPSKNPTLQTKRRLFVRVLTGMRAVVQPGEPESVLEYTKLWSELIDRGGLYHINDEVNYFVSCTAGVY